MTFFYTFTGSNKTSANTFCCTVAAGYHLNHQGEVLAVQSVEGALVFTAIVSRRAVGSPPSWNRTLSRCPPTCSGAATSSVFDSAHM